MEIISASIPAGDRPNEDYLIVGPRWAIVLDGATPRAGVNSGCVHDVPWLVRQLGSRLAASLTTEPKTVLADALADAIDGTRTAHGPACDLANPDSPSSTVAVLRQRCHGSLDYLVLGDSPLLLDVDGLPFVVADERSGRLPDYTEETVRSHRNQPHGFWIASTVVEAAQHAVTGTTPPDGVRLAALVTDGITRYVDRLGLGSWRGLLHNLAAIGPEAVVAAIRTAERDQLPVVSTEPRTGRHLKRHDDATAVVWVFTRDVPSG